MTDSNCTHNCDSCGVDCESRAQPESFLEQPHANSNIKKVIGVVSGKGGVGKSLVTSLMAVAMRRRLHNVAVLDADVTGPSIPKSFGVKGMLMGSEEGVFPAESKTGIKLVSLNLLLENDTDPVVWRGPIIAGTVKQFWTEVMWGDVDFMFVDMPPGTGDVPLTVFQSLPLDGIIVVTTPQELVGMIVSKAVRMAEMMNIPVLGIVENMAYFDCPDCNSRHAIYGESHLEEIAAQFSIPVAAQLPINPKLAAAVDKGMIELYEGDWLDALAESLEEI
ncbi:MAG: P-loop NTPase [Christensenellales bacterium]|jgi:Mrp family chromosome partitioning ATPase